MIIPTLEYGMSLVKSCQCSFINQKVADVPGQLVHKPDTKENKMVFNVVIRRKTLFYTVILIIPTVLMAFLSVMAFYLPVDSGEKVSLTISLLLALVVFLLLVSKVWLQFRVYLWSGHFQILPPTSNIPLMGKYLLLAFVLNIVAVVVRIKTKGSVCKVLSDSDDCHHSERLLPQCPLPQNANLGPQSIPGVSAAFARYEKTRENSDIQWLLRGGILRVWDFWC